MAIIKDSEAYLNKERLLAQHQAALSILQGKLDNPKVSDFSWLDLGCGKGQIIINLEYNIGDTARAKVSYSAFDIKEEHLSITLKKAETLKFKVASGKVGDILDFPKLFELNNKFDFITLTNSIHEFSPFVIPHILFECLIRLTTNGLLFVYDMESLPSLELGAVTWTREEIHELSNAFLINLGIKDYFPTPGKWRHSSCDGWNLQINRDYISISDEDLLKIKDEAIEKTKIQIVDILKRKLSECEKSLESITMYRAETEDEDKLKQKLLYDFWSLTRIKEIK